MSEVIGPELCFETLFGASKCREKGDCSIIDENLKWEHIAQVVGHVNFTRYLAAHMDRKTKRIDLSSGCANGVSR